MRRAPKIASSTPGPTRDTCQSTVFSAVESGAGDMQCVRATEGIFMAHSVTTERYFY
eukprot:CAMPEP_0167814902 /NCGR_PEP_ID=MMETSP0112_2-20121227/2702_1 /TAXON_ID=91324 /ORGANISM="Lotharella globosa, Strain CCCM811" /LENGTH=56 /DNA_ID=CAMNT_0007714217 /DNA_START=215 /DNA_END=382 /DNA_ORIENTATION=-